MEIMNWKELSEEELARRYLMLKFGLAEDDEDGIKRRMPIYHLLYGGPGKPTLKETFERLEQKSEHRDEVLQRYRAALDAWPNFPLNPSLP